MKKYVSTLITVQGIIVAGLLVWAQFWDHAYDIYTSYKPPDPIWHVSLILGTLYVAVLFSILGIIFAIFSLREGEHKCITRIAITFWGYSWTFIIVLIIVSLVPLFIKAWGADQYWHALNITDWISWLDPQNALWLFIGGSVVVLLFWGLYLAKKLESTFMAVRIENDAKENVQ